MREMVFNHASISAPDLQTAIEHLKGTTKGIARLINARVVESALRWDRVSEQIVCVGEWSLAGVLQEMRRHGARDEYVYFRRLTLKYPLLHETSQEIKDRIVLCEATGCGSIRLSAEDGNPLLLCAIGNGIAISFPSATIWERDEVDVNFVELLPNDEFVPRLEAIDNLARLEHAEAIVERHQRHVRTDISSFREMWNRRREAFRNLVFGPDVEVQLGDVNAGDLKRIVKKLSIIDAKSGDWASGQGGGPPWRGLVRDESDSVYQNESWLAKRRFKSYNGNQELFMLHSSFSRGDRIHMRVDANKRLVEIGYIGVHLSTKNDP